MTALLSLLLMVAACLGAGTAALRGLGFASVLPPREWPWWTFGVGMGIVGWLIFPIGVCGGLNTPVLAGLALALTAGLLLWPRGRSGSEMEPWTAAGFLIVLAIGMLAATDLIEALAPPTDADSLSYHFALPKQFLAAGRIEFVPRAVDGAAPLLVQMTYLMALSLGGERAMTLWTMVSCWAASGLLFCLARRYLSRNWSLAVAAIFASTPAVLYGGGSGQVEVRNALFVLICSFGAATAIRTLRFRHVALAGMAAGFFAAAKLFGLILVGLVGLLILLRSRRPLLTLCFFSAAAAAASQWYLWNWWHTGDPLFPLLYGMIGNEDYRYWNSAIEEAFRADLFVAEQGVPVSVFWLLAYPVVATFFGLPIFEAGRTGLGVFPAILAPFALAGAWTFRRRIAGSDLTLILLIAVLFYAVWFLLGAPQRVRHLLPVYPLLLLGLSVVAIGWAGYAATRAPLIAGAALVIGVQFCGQLVFIGNFLKPVLFGEDRDSFYDRMVPVYAAVPWVNANLGPGDRLLFNLRVLDYLIDAPSLHLHPSSQIVVEIHAKARDLDRFRAQLREQRITHILGWDVQEGDDSGNFFGLLRGLIEAGCTDTVHRFQARFPMQRTLAREAAADISGYILRLRLEACRS